MTVERVACPGESYIVGGVVSLRQAIDEVRAAGVDAPHLTASFVSPHAVQVDVVEPSDEQCDNVNHPPHYTHGSIECIDAIRAALGRDGFLAYCRGNAIKYAWRSEHKGGEEDLQKAAWYLNRAAEERSKPCE